MDIDGADIDDGAIAAHSWPPAFDPQMEMPDRLNTQIPLPQPMPMVQPLEKRPLKPIPILPQQLTDTVTSTPAPPPARLQASWASDHHSPLRSKSPLQHSSDQEARQPTSRKPVPRPKSTSPPVPHTTPSPTAQPIAPTPTTHRVAPTPTNHQIAPKQAQQVPPTPTGDQVAPTPTNVSPTSTQPEGTTSTDEPMSDTPPSQESNEVPTDIHEIMIRAKEMRLPIVEEEEGKLQESRTTGERPIDVALAEARLITQNVYVHREPRTQEQDEISICLCRRPEIESQLGCLEDCVNRAALIECHPDYCPCGDQCDNQRIQRGLMPVAEIIDAGKKGLGIVTRQFIKRGEYVAEYMGEIVTEQEYHLRRLRYHNEKHRYMMVLSGGEVIDATRMGGLARFINHCCDPNCGVEKWEVQGEERCGIFALRDINAGEELSFDYKFESFSKLEITMCLCGASNCRGYIGINNRAAKQPRKGSASHTAFDRAKRLDPITKKETSGRKTMELALERMYRALAGHRVFTRKEIAMLLDSRLLLKRNLLRNVDENMRFLCLEPYFVSEEDDETNEMQSGFDMPPVFNVRELPEFPPKQILEPRTRRQERLEAVLDRLRTRFL